MFGAGRRKQRDAALVRVSESVRRARKARTANRGPLTLTPVATPAAARGSLTLPLPLTGTLAGLRVTPVALAPSVLSAFASNLAAGERDAASGGAALVGRADPDAGAIDDRAAGFADAAAGAVVEVDVGDT